MGKIKSGKFILNITNISHRNSLLDIAHDFWSGQQDMMDCIGYYSIQNRGTEMDQTYWVLVASFQFIYKLETRDLRVRIIHF